MRYITLIALVVLVVACDRGAKQQLPPNAVGTIKVVEGFSGPEAVRYDPELDVYFVSNFNGKMSGDANGFVSKVSTEGEIIVLEFMRGSERWPLHGPRGMYIDERGLWVADADGVHLFDRETGKQLGFIDLSALEPDTLNDVVLASDGALYVTDTGKKVVYRIIDGAVTIATQTEMNPNGITVNPANGRLLLAPWADANELIEWDFNDGAFHSVGKFDGGGRFDGIEVVGDNIIVSSQQDMSLHILVDGKDQHAIALPGKPADIAIDTRRNRVIVPYVALNRIDIIELDSSL